MRVSSIDQFFDGMWKGTDRVDFYQMVMFELLALFQLPNHMERYVYGRGTNVKSGRDVTLE